MLVLHNFARNDETMWQYKRYSIRLEPLLGRGMPAIDPPLIPDNACS